MLAFIDESGQTQFHPLKKIFSLTITDTYCKELTHMLVANKKCAL